MNRSALGPALALPFLVALAGLVPVALLGSCDNVTTCGAKSFSAGPIMLVVVLITGFAAGRVSSSWAAGFVAVLAATGLVVGVIEATELWGPSADAGGATFLGGLVIVLILPGFAIGRSRHDAAAVATLGARHDEGLITSDDFARQLAERGRALSQDQAPPNHRCGRCGKPLSPVWHGKCLHCGAPYTEFPPVPRTSQPDR